MFDLSEAEIVGFPMPTCPSRIGVGDLSEPLE